MVLCDQVITDDKSGKKSLIGIFGTLNSAAYPTQRDMTIFAQVTDCAGKYSFKLELVNIDDDGVAGEGGMEAKIPGRLIKCDLVFTIPVGVPKPGNYEFRLYANGAYLGRVTFNAIQKKGA